MSEKRQLDRKLSENLVRSAFHAIRQRNALRTEIARPIISFSDLKMLAQVTGLGEEDEIAKPRNAVNARLGWSFSDLLRRSLEIKEKNLAHSVGSF